jgi:hypothetical protein
MKKNGKLPIPKPNYFIEKGDFGDDAGFYSENVYGDAIGLILLFYPSANYFLKIYFIFKILQKVLLMELLETACLDTIPATSHVI